MASTAEPEDFDSFFYECFPAARHSAFRVLGDPQAAEDAAATAMAKAYADWPRVSGLAYRRAWVIRVAVNQALGVRRRRRAPAVRPSPVEAAEAEILIRLELLEAVRRLPRRQREALVLRYLGDLSEQEVAEVMGLAAGSVKSHIHRGLEALRVLIRPEGVGPDAVLDR